MAKNLFSDDPCCNETLGLDCTAVCFSPTAVVLLLGCTQNGIDTEHSDDKIATMKVKVKKAVEVVCDSFVCTACFSSNAAQA